jgi:uncharacterized protein YggE
MKKARFLCAIAAALSISSAARAGPDDAKPPVIQITGTGSVRAEPDIATVRVGVTADDANAQEAVARNTAATQKVVRELEAAAIEKKDLKTSNFSVFPQYRTDNDKKQTLTYRASNTVTVTIRDIAKVGEILTKVVAAGSNQITGPSFAVSEPEKYLNEARKKAVENALSKATVYAAAANLKLGPVLEMIEGGASVPLYSAHAPMATRALAAPVPIETGEETIQAQISLVIELKP